MLLEEAVIELLQALKKFVKEFFRTIKRVLIKIIEQIDIEKFIKYRKYQKRVVNRKRLFAKRKAKYGR